jgi:NADP-dependent 3-hydroxy acid dehydrogenase YdfG
MNPLSTGRLLTNKVAVVTGGAAGIGERQSYE